MSVMCKGGFPERRKRRKEKEEKEKILGLLLLVVDVSAVNHYMAEKLQIIGQHMLQSFAQLKPWGMVGMHGMGVVGYRKLGSLRKEVRDPSSLTKAREAEGERARERERAKVRESERGRTSLRKSVSGSISNRERSSERAIIERQTWLAVTCVFLGFM